VYICDTPLFSKVDQMLETNLSCCVKLTRDFVKFMLEAPSSTELDHVGPIGDVAPSVCTVFGEDFWVVTD
jgi:hypothetical protein